MEINNCEPVPEMPQRTTEKLRDACGRKGIDVVAAPRPPRISREKNRSFRSASQQAENTLRDRIRLRQDRRTRLLQYLQTGQRRSFRSEVSILNA